MPRPEHVYEIEVAAGAAAVWTALTDSDWTRRYLFGTVFVDALRAGRPYRTVLPDGSPAVEGTVTELTPPAGGAPGRFVQTWHIRYDEALAAEPPGLVEWTVTPLGLQRTRVRLVHGGLGASLLTSAEVEDGWVGVLERLRAALEDAHRSQPVS